MGFFRRAYSRLLLTTFLGMTVLKGSSTADSGDSDESGAVRLSLLHSSVQAEALPEIGSSSGRTLLNRTVLAKSSITKIVQSHPEACSCDNCEECSCSSCSSCSGCGSCGSCGSCASCSNCDSCAGCSSCDSCASCDPC